jgi:hypothetical protein
MLVGFKLISMLLMPQPICEDVGDICRNLTLKECEDETHTPKMGTWESFGTLEMSKFDCRGKNTSHWGILYIIGKLSKSRCRKWARMNHLDIYITSYGSLTPDHEKSGIDPTPMCAGEVGHIVGKLLTRFTTLLQTSSQSEV